MLLTNIHTTGFEPEATHGANNGLKVARDLLEQIHAKYPEISYGDLWTLAGVCAIQELVGFFLFPTTQPIIITHPSLYLLGWSYYSLAPWSSRCHDC